MSLDMIEDLFKNIGEKFLNLAVEQFNEYKHYAQQIHVVTVTVSYESNIRTFQVNPIDPKLAFDLFNEFSREEFMVFINHILNKQRKASPDKEHFIVCGSEAYAATDTEINSALGYTPPSQCKNRQECLLVIVYHHTKQSIFTAYVRDEPHRHAYLIENQIEGHPFDGEMVINADIHPDIERIIKNVSKR